MFERPRSMSRGRHEFLILNSQFLIGTARASSTRIPARSARLGRHRLERLGGTVRLRSENRQQLLQVDAVAGGTRRRLVRARQVLELLSAAAAFVFEKRHGVF